MWKLLSFKRISTTPNHMPKMAENKIFNLRFYQASCIRLFAEPTYSALVDQFEYWFHYQPNNDYIGHSKIHLITYIFNVRSLYPFTLLYPLD